MSVEGENNNVAESDPNTVKEEVTKKPFGEEAILITDSDISDEIYGSYQGFKFVCPECQVPSIMINSDITPMCLKCGRRVVVRSATVDRYKTRYSL